MLNRGIVPATWFLWMSVGIIFAWCVIFGIETWALSEYLNRAPLPLYAVSTLQAVPCSGALSSGRQGSWISCNHMPAASFKHITHLQHMHAEPALPPAMTHGLHVCRAASQYAGCLA